MGHPGSSDPTRDHNSRQEDWTAGNSAPRGCDQWRCWTPRGVAGTPSGPSQWVGGVCVLGPRPPETPALLSWRRAPTLRGAVEGVLQAGCLLRLGGKVWRGALPQGIVRGWGVGGLRSCRWCGENHPHSVKGCLPVPPCSYRLPTEQLASTRRKMLLCSHARLLTAAPAAARAAAPPLFSGEFSLRLFFYTNRLQFFCKNEMVLPLHSTVCIRMASIFVLLRGLGSRVTVSDSAAPRLVAPAGGAPLWVDRPAPGLTTALLSDTSKCGSR